MKEEDEDPTSIDVTGKRHAAELRAMIASILKIDPATDTEFVLAQVMRQTRGQANPRVIVEMIQEGKRKE